MVDLLAGLILSCCGGRILNLCWEPASGPRRFIPVLLEGDAALERELVLAAMLRRLNTVTGLDEEDIAAIRALPIVVRQWEAGRPIVSDGDRPTDCCLLIEGFCVRAKTTFSGQRQILSIHIPGDIPDLQSLHLHRMDHDLVPVVPSTLGLISHASL